MKTHVEEAEVRKLPVEVETNIDDMSPQVIGYVIDRALELGALDCYLTQTQMKKNRPGILLSVLAKPEKADELTQIIFSESTTLGVRRREEQRQILARTHGRSMSNVKRSPVKARVRGR